MEKQLFFRRKLVTAVMAVFAMTGSAIAQENEPANDVLDTAQPLTIGSDGSASVSGVIGTLGGEAVVDVDFYSFDAYAGNEVTINIDGAAGGLRGFDSIIYLFGPGIMGYRDFDDYHTTDEGSPAPNGTLDSRVDKFLIEQTGRYTVGVTALGVQMNEFGSYPSFPTPDGGNGDYTLKISGVVAPAPGGDPTDPGTDPGTEPGPVPGPVVQPASIEIKTSGELIRGSRREILIALLSSADFDPRNVDVTSLSFALGNGQAGGFKRCSKHGWRINRDNRRDLVCHFSTDVNVPAGSVEAVLRGKMKNNGYAFEGKSTVRVIDRHAGRRDRDRDHDRDGRRGRDRD